MADHGLRLMQAIQTVLDEQVPLAGGWQATRLKSPRYPVGYIDLTGSTPGHGVDRYTENHRGVISVWHQPPEDQQPHPAEAFRLSHLAHVALSTVADTQGDFTIQRLNIGPLVPSNPDGLTWGRTFTFTATTYEAHNGTEI